MMMALLRFYQLPAERVGGDQNFEGASKKAWVPWVMRVNGLEDRLSASKKRHSHRLQAMIQGIICCSKMAWTMP